jgi:hypothetical protein
MGAAREKVRVAHALPNLPKIAAAMACGQLSYSKVRALTRVASAATEDDFLSIALHGTAHHVESWCAFTAVRRRPRRCRKKRGSRRIGVSAPGTIMMAVSYCVGDYPRWRARC